MSGASYTTIFWHFLLPADVVTAERVIAGHLANGWQLHGGPIALPGERVLQALVKPAVGVTREYWDGWRAGFLAGKVETIEQSRSQEPKP
jgi:hypothetical protein